MIVGFGALEIHCPEIVVRTPGSLRRLYWPMEFWGRQFSVGVKMPSWPVSMSPCGDEGAGCCELPDRGKWCLSARNTLGRLLSAEKNKSRVQRRRRK
jgi:hypothetical protein